jgi:hypothetical protein
MMHPLEKILVLMALCQALTTFYLVMHATELHGPERKGMYLLKISPLVVATLFMAILILRLFHLIPYVGI